MSREEILEILRADFAHARMKASVASQHFDEVTSDTPSGLPHPDGAYRIRNASIEYAAARTALTFALTRLNSFVIHGTIPNDL